VLRELVISVASGLIVALILGVFRRGGQARPRRRIAYESSPPRPLLGGLMRLILAVGGGIGLAYVLAPMLVGRRFGYYGGYGRYDGSLAAHTPMIVLTVLGTAVVWLLLSALSRR
jgi:hypothetical protein